MKNHTPNQSIPRSMFIPFVIVIALSLSGMSCDSPDSYDDTYHSISDLKIEPLNQDRVALTHVDLATSKARESYFSRYLGYYTMEGIPAKYDAQKITRGNFSDFPQNQFAINNQLAINQNGMAVTSVRKTRFDEDATPALPIGWFEVFHESTTVNLLESTQKEVLEDFIPARTKRDGEPQSVLIGIQSATSTSEVMALMMGVDKNLYKRIFTDISMSWDDSYDISHNNNPPRDANSVVFSFGFWDATVAWVTDENELFVNIHENNGIDNIEQAQLIKRTDSRVEVLDVKQSHDANHRMVLYTVDGILSIAYNSNLASYYWTSRPLTLSTGVVDSYDFAMAENGSAIVSWTLRDSRNVYSTTFGYTVSTSTFWSQAEEFENGSVPRVSINASGNGILVYQQGGDLISREFSGLDRTWSEASTIANNITDALHNPYDVYIGDSNKRMAAWVVWTGDDAVDEFPDHFESLILSEIQTYFYPTDPPTGTEAVLTLDVSGAGFIYFFDDDSVEHQCDNNSGGSQQCTFSLPTGTTVALEPAPANSGETVSWAGCDEDWGIEGCVITVDGNKTVTATFEEI